LHQYGFAEQAGGTLAPWRMLFQTAAEYEKVKTYAVEARAKV